MTQYLMTEDEREELLKLCDVRSPIWSPEYYTRALNKISARIQALPASEPADDAPGS